MGLERLEDRVVPSILFGDNPGLTTSDNLGPMLANAQVRVVFWGSGWSSHSALQTQVQNAIDSLNSSTYFHSSLPGADLSQYRVGSAAKPTRVASFNDNFNSPGATFTANDAFNMLSHEFGSAPNYYYWVIPNPGSILSGGINAVHTFGTVNGNRLYFGTTRDLATPSLDDLTYLYSHEMTESITDPDGTALQVNPRNTSSWNEICDGEAQNYSYRLNGVLAQSYWSQANGKFTVPTGQTQNFYVSSARVLTVNGDQLSSNHNDTITLDVSGSGGVLVTLNGETAQFDPGAISSIVVNMGGGTDTVNVLRTVVPVSVNYGGGGGSDVANFGTGGSVQGIQASVSIVSPSRTQVTIDDSADGGNRSATLSSGGITGLAPAALNFTSAAVNTLTIRGGGGTDTYTVTGTPASTSVTLNTGGGNDTVNVEATTSTVALNLGSGTNTINLSPTANNLANLAGLVNITGQGGTNTLNSCDQAATFSQDRVGENLYQDHLTRVDTPGVERTVFTYSGIQNLNAFTGHNDNFPDVSFGVESTLVGTNVAVSNASTHNIQFYAQGPSGTLDSIQGPVTLHGRPGGADELVIADAPNNPQSYTVTARTVLFRSNLPPLTYDNETSVILRTSPQAPATVNVLSTAATTSGYTRLDLGAAGSNAILGNQGSVAGLLGEVDVRPLNVPVSVTVDDSADPMPRTATLTADSSVYNLNGLAPSVIAFTPLSGSSMQVLGGSGGNTFNVQGLLPGTTLSLSGGSGTNTLQGPDSATTWQITGSNAGSFTGGLSFTSMQNLTGGASDNIFVIGSGASLDGTITGGGGTNTLVYSAYTGNVIVDLQTGFATAIGGGLSGTFVNVHGSNTSGSGLYNLLIGAGGNVLTGGTGRRNILVAGGSASTLLGGTQDDLLHGGTTSYDTEAGLTSWQQVAAYWAGTDPFPIRVNNLENGNGVPLLDATTVTGNGGGNTMTGSNELALIYSDGSDTISGFDPSSQQVAISP